jgi:hypothetical protein
MYNGYPRRCQAARYQLQEPPQLHRRRGWQIRLGAPDEEVFSFVNDLERSVGTYLYGRRMYEMMTVWETDPAAAAQSCTPGRGSNGASILKRSGN